MTLSYITLMGYAFFAKSLKSWFASNNRALWYNRMSGLFFMGLGLGLLGLERK